MLLLSELLGKELKNERTGEICGKIEAVAFDNASRRCCFVTGNGIVQCKNVKWKNGELLFRPKDDKLQTDGSTGTDGGKNCTLGEHVATIALGKPAYDTNGKTLGAVSDAEINSSGTLATLSVDGVKYRSGQIRCVGDAVLVKVKSAAQIAAEIRRQEKLRETAYNTDAPIATEQTSAENTSPELDARQNLTRKKYGNFNFLIGKTVDKMITNFQGEVMIKSGEIVTSNVLRQAKISGKLIELYLHIE